MDDIDGKPTMATKILVLVASSFDQWYSRLVRWVVADYNIICQWVIFNISVTV